MWNLHGNDLLSREIPLPSALRSLTTVFGMVTGVPFLPSSPHSATLLSLLNDYLQSFKTEYLTQPEIVSWLSPRPISTRPLHMLPYVHFEPIYLIVFQGSYFLRMGNLILKLASRLDAFSAYPSRT